MSGNRYTDADIGPRVLEKINRGEVAMRSNLYFALITIAGAVATVTSAVLFAYFVRIVTTSLRIASADTPAYGARQNLEQLLSTFPWWSALIALISGVLAMWLLRRYGRLYRYRISLVIVGFVVMVTIAGVLLSFVGIGHQPSADLHDRGGAQRGKMR